VAEGIFLMKGSKVHELRGNGLKMSGPSGHGGSFTTSL